MRRIVVFFKFPEPGKVKTRLAAAIGDEAAASLARLFVEETLARAVVTGLPVDISFSPKRFRTSLRKWLGPGHEYAPQCGGDLGQRMLKAFQDAFARGAKRVALTGTDSPDRPAEYLTHALDCLDRHDVAVGPALDGGYHLLAMRRDRFTPEVFKGIAWSTPLVLEQTLRALGAANRSVHLLPSWPDIDEYTDLVEYLARNPEITREVPAWGNDAKGA